MFVQFAIFMKFLAIQFTKHRTCIRWNKIMLFSQYTNTKTHTRTLNSNGSCCVSDNGNNWILFRFYMKYLGNFDNKRQISGTGHKAELYNNEAKNISTNNSNNNAKWISIWSFTLQCFMINYCCFFPFRISFYIFLSFSFVFYWPIIRMVVDEQTSENVLPEFMQFVHNHNKNKQKKIIVSCYAHKKLNDEINRSALNCNDLYSFFFIQFFSVTRFDNSSCFFSSLSFYFNMNFASISFGLLNVYAVLLSPLYLSMYWQLHTGEQKSAINREHEL